MKRIIKLTESDLTKIVRLVIKESNYYKLIDPSHFDYNNGGGDDYIPFYNLLTKKHNFEYLKNNNGTHTFIFKKDDCDVIVGTKSSYDVGKDLVFIYIVNKKNEIINFIEEVTGKPGLKVSSNETTKVSRFVKNAMEFDC